MSSAAALISGPTSMSGSSPDPSLSSRVLSSRRWSSGSRTACSTMTREQAVQRCPVVPNADHRMPSVARSRSASARTTTPFLPPSSSDRRFNRRPARSAMPVPVAELPVNDMTATSGLSTIALPTSAPVPVTRLTTPAGKPASAISSTRSVAQCGVSEDGLKTTVLPVTSAGIIFQHGIAIGKFQGVMTPATPSGWRMLIAHLSGSSDGTVSPAIRRPSPAIRNAMSMPFLDVAARLGQDLAHLAGHRPRQPFLVLGHQRAEGVQDLAALGRRRALPHRLGRLGGPDGHRDVGRRPLLEPSDDVAIVGRVAALEGRPGRGFAPLPGDEVAERRGVAWDRGIQRGGSLGHRVPGRAEPAEQGTNLLEFVGAQLERDGAVVVHRPLRGFRRPARTRPRPSPRRRGKASPGRSGPRAGEARGAAWPRSGRRTRRSGGRVRSRRH